MTTLHLLILSNLVLAIGLIALAIINRPPKFQVTYTSDDTKIKRVKKFEKPSHKSKGKNPGVSSALKRYWANMTPEERKKEGQRRLMVARNNRLAREKGLTVGDVTGKQRGKRNGWQRKRISKGIQKYWDSLTPEQRRIRLDKSRRTRELNKLIKENPSFHGSKQNG